MRTKLRASEGSFEVLSAKEEVLAFSDRDTAVRFLRALAGDPVAVQQMRSYLGESHINLHIRSDHQIVDLMADTLVAGRVQLLRIIPAGRVAARGSRLPSAAEGTIPQQATPIAPATAPPPPDDAAEIDQDLQAEALENAARDGVPFCEECEKRKRKRKREMAAAA